MVHFPGLARTRLCVQRAVTWFYQVGFPHSDIPGSRPVCGFPRLIAAYHVLHRLLAPRHPPYALSSLTIKLTEHVAFAAACPATGFKRTAPLVWLSSPFHIALLSSKICSLSRRTGLDTRTTQCQLPSVVKDRCSAQQLPIGTSPLQAEREISLEPKSRTIKNPTSSAGLFRPSLTSHAAKRRTDKLEARFASIRYW